MTKTDLDRVEKQIELKAPPARVWRAISSPKEFGAWFGLGTDMGLVGEFVPGATITCRWLVDGREVSGPFCTIEQVEPEALLAFRWVPYEAAAGADPAAQTTTRIEMRLEEIAGGTRLTIVESGFAKLPADKQYKRDENGEGWALQLHSIAQHVLGRIEVRIEDHIARPPAEVFEAIIDPAKLAQYFVSRASARIAPGPRITWEFADVGASLSIKVREVVQDKKIVFVWSATGTPTQVTLSLEPDGARTKIIAAEGPFELSEEAAARATGQTRGWTDFCLCLKAYLQHGINLRLGKPADHVA